MPLDTSVFDKIRTFPDYNKAEQDFQLRRQLAAQQLQSGGIDAASKANIYATQVLSAATATGDQGAYDTAKQHLAQNGIDVSTWAPDVASGAQQAQAARLAQSPLGSLLNAGLKAESNTIAGTQAMGNSGAGLAIAPLSSALLGGNALGLVPSGGAKPSAPSVGTISTNPAPSQKRIMPQPDQNAAIKELYPDDAPAQPVILSNDTQQPTIQTASPNTRFSPPKQDTGETNQAYNQRVQTAFEAYKADPDYIAKTEKIKKKAELAATNEENAVHSQEMTQRLNQNLDALEKLVPDLPSSDLIDPATKAYIGKRNPLSDKKAATAYSQFQEINQQQMINGLSELVKSGQIRGNQFIEKIISRGYMINPDDPKEAQIADIKNLKAELANINTSAQNIAGAKEPYQAIPVNTSAQPNVISYQEYFK